MTVEPNGKGILYYLSTGWKHNGFKYILRISLPIRVGYLNLMLEYFCTMLEHLGLLDRYNVLQLEVLSLLEG